MELHALVLCTLACILLLSVQQGSCAPVISLREEVPLQNLLDTYLVPHFQPSEETGLLQFQLEIENRKFGLQQFLHEEEEERQRKQHLPPLNRHLLIDNGEASTTAM